MRDVLAQKSRAGVEVPTYPQFRDMIRMFMDPIENPACREPLPDQERECQDHGAGGGACRARMCASASPDPVELYISAFGATNYPDILYNLAKSVARFLENGKEEGKMVVASLDEPSLGLSSNIVFSEDEIFEALEIASAPCRGMDCEVHLHSPLYAEACARVPGISIVGIESAAHPDYLKLIDKKVLEETDTFLRAGIARTDILSMTARLNEKLGINLWDDMARLEMEILDNESPQVMKKRLERAYAKFGERLRATGPDCGLGSWPSQDLAGRILANCAAAVRSFRLE